MKGAKPFGTVHVVTAAESAYADFYGHFSRFHLDGQWGATWPLIYDSWPLRLLSIYAEVLTAANIPKRGIPVWLYAPWRPTDLMSLWSGVQGHKTKAVWHGELQLEFGFGVQLSLGAVITGDRVSIGGTYEPF